MLNRTRLARAFCDRMQHANPDSIPLKTAPRFAIERIPNRSIRFANDLPPPEIIDLSPLTFNVETQPERVFADFVFYVAQPRRNRRPILIPHSSVDRADNLMIANPNVPHQPR